MQMTTCIVMKYFQVRAYSIGGDGPWSSEFHGRTLDNTDVAPKLICALDKDILLTNLAGSKSSILVSQETLKVTQHVKNEVFHLQCIISDLGTEAREICALEFLWTMVMIPTLDQFMIIFFLGLCLIDQYCYATHILFTLYFWLNIMFEKYCMLYLRSRRNRSIFTLIEFIKFPPYCFDKTVVAGKTEKWKDCRPSIFS